MLRFFRQIRKKLMEQNKVRTYLLYATGEIALVVIGILIALSINNWNEASKMNKLKEVYTQNLLNDLTTDTLQLNANIELNESLFFKYY